LARLHKPKAGFWIRTWVVILFPVTSLFFKLRWRHLDRIPAPERGGVIIAMNHLSHADTILMARLIYSAIMSLDGYTADADGHFEWAAPDEEVHAFVNELERPVGTYLYGRGMYETMRYWETAHTLPGQRPVSLDFARIWQAADKIVYSTTLTTVSTARTRIERDFDPETVRDLKASAEADISVGGADLAAHAFRAGLVDECHLFVAPAVVGGGTRLFPHVRAMLELVDERRFSNGTVHLRYLVTPNAPGH